MAKVINLKSKTGRDDLVPRREPYWHRVRKGLYLGYRKLVQGEGTWIARLQDDQGKKKYQALGTFIDPRDKSGSKALDTAVKEAEKWADQLEMGISPKALTVAETCRTYVEALKMRKSAASAADADGRFKRLVYEAKIGNVLLTKLKATDVESWLNKQVDLDDDEDDVRKSKDSANRNLSALKAALNKALGDRLIASDTGWRTVKPFKDVGMRRVGWLTMEERGKLMKACPDDLASLIKALLLTAARPGELAAACVKDFDKGQGTLALSGKTGHRVVTLSTVARAFFSEVIKDRIGNAPLLPREYGDHWNKDAWKKMFKEAVKAAGLSGTTVMYTLRHVAITELVNSGMDSFVVAQLAGTSTAMIDKHYGHLRHDKTRSKLDAVRMV